MSRHAYMITMCGMLIVACKPASLPSSSPPAPPTANGPSAAIETPEITGVRLALAIDPKTMQLRGSGSVFQASVLNRLKKMRVAVLLKGLRGGETLTLTLIDPEGKAAEPIVKQYGPDERGDFYAAAFFESNRWRPGTHQINVNLNEQSFAIQEFIVVP